MVIAAVVILYYPDVSVIANIKSYSVAANTVYVIDNTETPSVAIIQLLKEIINLRYYHDGENLGIAVRLNQACNYAKTDGYSWILTMDQDSYFLSEQLLAYLACFEAIESKEKIAIAGVVTDKEKIVITEGCMYKKVDFIITSGSVVNLNAFEEVGLFDEALFIDQVDNEFCYRAILKGFEIIQFTGVTLNHALGHTSLHTSFKTLTKTQRSLHSPQRLYYMTRNYFYVSKRYRNYFFSAVSDTRTDLLIRIKNNLLYNNRRFKYIFFIVKGFIDYHRNKMGRLKV